MTDEIPQMFAEAGVSPGQARSQAGRRLPSMASSAHSDTDFGDTGEHQIINFGADYGILI